MNRYFLEYKGNTYHVENCATCPARTKDENGKPCCEIRDVRLHVRIRGLFPSVTGYKARGYLPCPIYREGTKKLTPKSERIDKIPLHEKSKILGVLYCSWCGNRINPAKAVVIINDKEDGRIYDKFACLEEYLRTSNK